MTVLGQALRKATGNNVYKVVDAFNGQAGLIISELQSFRLKTFPPLTFNPSE
jgi:hypothetical protein